MADFTDRFLKAWTDKRIAAARLGSRQFHAARLAAEVLNEAALHGVQREEIESAIEMDLELYMFQALTTVRQEGRRAPARSKYFGQERVGSVDNPIRESDHSTFG